MGLMIFFGVIGFVIWSVVVYYGGYGRGWVDAEKTKRSVPKMDNPPRQPEQWKPFDFMPINLQHHFFHPGILNCWEFTIQPKKI